MRTKGRPGGSQATAPGPQPLHLTPAQRYTAAFIPALLVLAFGAATWWGTVRERATRAAVDDSYRTNETLLQLTSAAANAERAELRYVLTRDARFLPAIDRNDSIVRSLSPELRRLMENDPPLARARADTVIAIVAQRLATARRNVALAAAGRAAEVERALRSGADRTLIDHTAPVIRTLMDAERQELADRDAREERVTRGVVLLVVLGAAASALVSLLLNGLLSRYGAGQAAFAAELEAANRLLEEQQTELELQYEQLQEQSTELESQSALLLQQAAELETKNASLQSLAGELRERTQSAEEANRSKSRFLAAMSHDLRTPLNAILGYVDLLEMEVRGPVTAGQVSDLQRIRNSGRHLLSMITGILDFARIESGRLEVRLEPVPVAGLLRGIESSFLPQARQKELTYECDGGPDGLWASADAEKTEQVLLNLIGNAIKFTPAGGRIAVRCLEDGDHVAVQVRDTGDGIPEDRLRSIFEPFVQVDRENVAAHQRGVGLGLAISRELAAAMGGELTVESEVGKGSTFTLRLRRVADPGASSSPAADSDVTSSGAAGQPELV